MKQKRPNSAQPHAHGTMTKYFQPEYVGKQNKGKLAVIHPLPIKQSRTHLLETQPIDFLVQANQLSIKPIYQQKKLQKKPLPDQIKKPFLYVKAVVPKRKTQNTKMNHPDVWNFNTNVQTTRKPKYLVKTNNEKQKEQNKLSLYEIQQKKRNDAISLFEKLVEVDENSNIKQVFEIWAKDKKILLDKKDFLIDQKTFIQFIKEYASDRIKIQIIKDFFDSFKNPTQKTVKVIKENNVSTPNNQISFKAFAYNFQVYKRSKTQIHDILSDKAANKRYINLKIYIEHWNENYPIIKETMKDIKSLQNNYRNKFKEIKNSFTNPNQQEIKNLRKELKQPMIKYDRVRRQNIQKKIEQYLKAYQQKKIRIQNEYINFCEVYEEMILPNHNTFFKKKTIMKLLTPLFNENNIIIKQILQAYIGKQQSKYQQYLSVVSRIMMQFTNNKKKLNQKQFTFQELANYLYKNTTDKYQIYCMKKLVKQMKKQHCVKHQKFLQNFNEFPGDQQIELELMTKCFEIECTKVLFKNQIWTQLIDSIIIPDKVYQSKYHSNTINMNICIENIKKILEQLDIMMSVQLNKSQQISNLIQNITFQEFGVYTEILQRININQPQQNDTQQLQQPKELINKLSHSIMEMTLHDRQDSTNKKVKFADVAFNQIDKLQQIQKQAKRKQEELGNVNYNNGLKIGGRQANMIETIIKQKQQQEEKIAKQKDQQYNKIAKSLVRSVINKSNYGYQQSIINNLNKQKQQQYPQQSQQKIPNINMKTLTKSMFMNQPINVNAFDIRFHDSSLVKLQQQKKKSSFTKSIIMKGSALKTGSKIKKNQDSNFQNQVIGKSILLSNLPKIQELPNQDPLRVSKYLLHTLDNIDKQNKQKIQPKIPVKNIKDGVNTNYYKQLVDLQKKPTVFDCEGNSKYSLMLPVQYYTNVILNSNQDQQKWFLKPHHVQTLTQNPLSKKDNIVRSEYKSGLQRLQPKKRPDQYIIEDNIARKDLLIYQLQNRLTKLKEELNFAKRGSRIQQGAKVPSDLVDKYFSNLSKQKQNKQLQMVAFQSLLYDLRKKQRDMLVDYRQEELDAKGYPKQRWWQKKDKTFVEDYVRHRNILNELDKPQQSRSHIKYIQNLENKELY